MALHLVGVIAQAMLDSTTVFWGEESQPPGHYRGNWNVTWGPNAH